MTREELFKVISDWNDEKSDKRASILILTEDGDNNTDKPSLYAIGEIATLVNAIALTIETNIKFATLIAMALSIANVKPFERILNAIKESRKLGSNISDNKEK